MEITVSIADLLTKADNEELKDLFSLLATKYIATKDENEEVNSRLERMDSDHKKHEKKIANLEAKVKEFAAENLKLKAQLDIHKTKYP